MIIPLTRHSIATSGMIAIWGFNPFGSAQIANEFLSTVAVARAGSTVTVFDDGRGSLKVYPKES